MDTLFLSESALFRGITPQEIEAMMGCLRAVTKSYKRSETILSEGDFLTSIGMVLSGSVSIENNDVWGNRSILDRLGAGQIFAENYACVPGEPLMISAVAAEPAEILFMDTSCMLSVCAHTCSFHNRLIRNLLSISAQKSLNLSRRIMHTSSKSIRGRLLSFLSFQATKNGCREFEISFNRQQLADYLSVDRSAMSNELSKMQKDGIIEVKRNHFVLLDSDVM